MIRLARVKENPDGSIKEATFRTPRASDRRRYSWGMVFAERLKMSFPSLCNVMISRPERN